MINFFGMFFLLTRKDLNTLEEKENLHVEGELRSAEEVRKEFKRISDRNTVIAAIEKAAAKNRREVSVSGWLSKEQKNELREKGYFLTEYTYGYDPMTSIEW